MTNGGKETFVRSIAKRLNSLVKDYDRMKHLLLRLFYVNSKCIRQIL